MKELKFPGNKQHPDICGGCAYSDGVTDNLLSEHYWLCRGYLYMDLDGDINNE